MNNRPRDWLPAVVLLLIVALGIGGWLLFPRLQAFIAFQDCAAAGRVDCFSH